MDFKYILFDVKRYDDEELLKLANVIGSAFFMDKETDSKKITDRLRKIKELSNKLPVDDVNIFINWVKNILTRNLEKETKKEVEEIVDEMGDVENMVYAIEEAIMKERHKARIEGKIEGKIEDILELLCEVGNVSQDLEKHIKAQSDIRIIKDWHKLAARANNIQEFTIKIGFI